MIGYHALSLLPVLLFLAGLIALDSFKLVAAWRVMLSILAGGVAAGAAMVVNSTVVRAGLLDASAVGQYLAPCLEESLKALYCVYLIRTGRVGFMVDSAIHGFAVGAGFALVENEYYLYAMTGGGFAVWIVRGFGTALMHGASTGIVAILGKSLSERHPQTQYTLLPGLFLAILLHGAFNHFFVPAATAMAILIVVLPLVTFGVYTRSEHATREWLGVGFDSDRQLLEMISTGTLGDTNLGRYLRTLQDRFPAPIVADMLCLLRVYSELAIGAKGMLMMREAGFRVAADPEMKDRFAEMTFLQKSVGVTGMLALSPFLQSSPRDLWQLQVLHADAR
jgi:RsiW-degrading membrane proteinase PrsW (M82 family)